jgi:putative glycosyltransferase (TIGR04348 family)
MRIQIVTPAPPGTSYGNRITALRWARILRRLGHRVSISQVYRNELCDLLIALHARRSYSSIKRFHHEQPGVAIVVALTGTDLYRDLGHDRAARASLELASRIVVLQPRALEKLPPKLRAGARVIYQSAETVRQTTSASSARRNFEVCVIGHLRPVKDPFRAAMAARSLPANSRIRILQIGGALTKQVEQQARREARINRRYRWLAELSRSRTLRVLARCRLCVISSRMEGGANILSESIMTGVPVLASRIDGNVGILGADYPGLFGAGKTHELARLLRRAETDPKFMIELRTRIRKLSTLFDSAREDKAWARLLAEIRQR